MVDIKLTRMLNLNLSDPLPTRLGPALRGGVPLQSEQEKQGAAVLTFNRGDHGSEQAPQVTNPGKIKIGAGISVHDAEVQFDYPTALHLRQLLPGTQQNLATKHAAPADAPKFLAEKDVLSHLRLAVDLYLVGITPSLSGGIILAALREGKVFVRKPILFDPVSQKFDMWSRHQAVEMVAASILDVLGNALEIVFRKNSDVAYWIDTITDHGHKRFQISHSSCKGACPPPPSRS